EASSHTVCRRCSRRIFLISEKRGDDDARTRIQSGFFKRSAATTLIAYLANMGAVFDAPVCLTPGALGGGAPGGTSELMGLPAGSCDVLEVSGDDRSEFGACFRDRPRDAEIGKLRHH